MKLIRLLRYALLCGCFVQYVIGPSRGYSLDLSEKKPLGWAEIIATIKADDALREEIEVFVKKAKDEASQELICRPYRFEDIGKHRTWLDGRTEALEDEIRETFGLAMSDFAACNTLAGTLPLIAAGARFSADTQLKEYLTAQLEEVSSWQPLQRPGWTLFKPGNRLPEDGKDGNWLATGCGVRAIVTALEIMGDEVDETLRKFLAELLENEIAGVVDDWKTKRPWFVRGNNPITNQWVLPTEGLVRACVYLGVDGHREAYELSVKNLLLALSSHGEHGEFEEGIGYASFTLTSMLHAAKAMAVAGDRRALDHPFLRNFPVWAVHHIQPGRMTVNCFDAGNAQIPRDNANWRSLLTLLVFGTGSEVANWALWEQFDGPSDDLIGLACRATSPNIERTPPPLFAAYERAAMVVWRDSWQDDATGVWVRGGQKLDQHDHQDRGHVNFIANGKPILIEAGTPSYSNPDMGVHYASGAGHNVLQVGTFFPERPYPVQSTPYYSGWQPPGGIAPIAVHRLDEKGGSVLVDCSDCYPDVEKWMREVEWTGRELTVSDEVALKEGTQDIIVFRWHLGTDQVLNIKGKGKEIEVSWSDAIIRLKGREALEVRQYKAPDATVTSKEDNMHTCVEVKTQELVTEVSIITKVRPSSIR
ncbi:MAG: heparinase II/III family protein [bacterium]